MKDELCSTRLADWTRKGRTLKDNPVDAAIIISEIAPDNSGGGVFEDRIREGLGKTGICDVRCNSDRGVAKTCRAAARLGIPVSINPQFAAIRNDDDTVSNWLLLKIRVIP